MTNVIDTPIIPVEQYKGHELSEKDALALFELYNRINLEEDPDYIPPPDEQRLKGLRQPNPFVDEVRYLIRKDEMIIAHGGFGYMKENHPSYESNKQLVMINIQVHPDYRRQGLAKAILTKMLSNIRELEKSTIICGTSHDDGKAVAQHYGGHAALAGAENRLYLLDVDWDMLDQWISEGPQRAEGVYLEEFTMVPEDIADEYLLVYAETMMQQPLGDIEYEFKESIETRREQEKRLESLGVVNYTLISRETDGSISGLTELIYNPGTPHKVQQNLTGVKQKYRGRGLGKWLKAELLKRVYLRHPDIKYVSTGNADTNAPMLSINERMGFKRFKSNINFKFSTGEFLSLFE